jgi:Zn-finger nucleic acid-binding protein
MNEQELADIALCYQSMGIHLDATPAQIDQIYRQVTIGNKKQFSNPDPGLREEAKRSQELVEEMIAKIRQSATYRAMEKDYQKKAGNAPVSEPQGGTPVPAAAAGRVLCPRCQGSILKGLKNCPICQAPLGAGQVTGQATFFTPTKIILLCLVLVVASLAFFSFLHGGTQKDGLSDIDSLQQRIAPK